MISIVVGVSGHNSRRTENFLEFLLCVSKQMYSDYELIVVEQITDEQVYQSIVEASQTDCKYLQCAHPIFNRSWLFNIGANESQGNILAFLDADVVFGDDYLHRIVSDLRSPYMLGWNRSVWLNERGTAMYVAAKEYSENWPESQVTELKRPVFRGGSAGLSHIFTRKFFFDGLGGYNENFNQWGAEDNDMMTRAIVAAGKQYIMDYTLIHLYHEDRVRGAYNTRMWYFTNSNPELVTRKIKESRIGHSDGPALIDYLSGEEE